MRCNKRIVLGPRRETYCQRDLDHEGSCSLKPDRRPEFLNIINAIIDKWKQEKKP